MVSVSNLSIKNFRSIEHCDIEIHNSNALVGINSSRKSAVLKALNCFSIYLPKRKILKIEPIITKNEKIQLSKLNSQD